MQSIFSCRRMMAGMARASRPPRYNAYRFSADGDSITIEDSLDFGSGKFTIIQWVKPSTPSVLDYPVEIISANGGAGGGAGIGLYVEANGDIKAYGVLSGTAPRYSLRKSQQLLTAGTLYKVAYAYDGTQVLANRLKLYIDDVLATMDSVDSAGGINTDIDLSASIVLVNATANLRGDLADVRVFADVAKTLVALQAEALDGYVDPTVSYHWKLNGNARNYGVTAGGNGVVVGAVPVTL